MKKFWILANIILAVFLGNKIFTLKIQLDKTSLPSGLTSSLNKTEILRADVRKEFEFAGGFC